MNLADLTQIEIMVPQVINPRTLIRLKEQIQAIQATRSRFIVLRGSNQVFCKGLDFQWIASIDQDSFLNEIDTFYQIMHTLQSCEQITIAIVEGEVAGGGMGIVAACDFVIASPESRFSLPEGKLGIIPGVISPFLLKKLSPKQIKKMVFTGEQFTPNQMADFDFVDEVVDETEIDMKLVELLQGMEACKKQSVADLKQLLLHADLQPEELYRLGVANLKEKLSSPTLQRKFAAVAEYLSN